MTSKTTFARRLQREQLIRLVSFLGVIGLFFVILLTVENMLVSSLLAFVFSYMLSPVVNFLERKGIHRILAIIIVFALVTLLFGGLVSATFPFISDQVTSLKSELPKYIEGTIRMIEDTEERLASFSGTLFTVDISDQVETTLLGWTSSIFEDLPTLVTKLFTTLILAPFFAFFLLKDGRTFSKILLAMVPNNIFEMVLNLYSQINGQIGQFVRARLLEAAFVGVVVWVGLFVLGARYATLLAIFAALTNLIPYIGPFIGAVPALIIALINGESTLGLFLVMMVYLAAQIVDALFLIPMVVAKIVDLHPITVVIAIIIGAQLMGVLGMLISIPVASALKVTITSVYLHLTGFRT
ncbi:MAG: AI-2E family transporter [Bdellovibrionaceae bacterium]|nr:AI-2E family transporter [Bdellovibrionales bacterium]MCB9085524.1 AI-2E family transporter [Pseudobdellovibrionaceae bacterium]